MTTLYLIRHGETEWSQSGQHTGQKKDIPLTPNGLQQSEWLSPRLASVSFDHVLCSPLKRAQQTCVQAGLSRKATIEPRLLEWDYGLYEGRTRAQILTENPRWDLFKEGAPQGESPEQVTARVDALLADLSNNSA